MILLLLALVQGPAVARQPELARYLSLARLYAAGERATAVSELGRLPPSGVEAAIAQLHHEESHLRARPLLSGEIDFRLVEAAVLLHAETGFALLQTGDVPAAVSQLSLSRRLYEWSHAAAGRLRARAEQARSEAGAALMRRQDPRVAPLPEAFEVTERIDRRDYHVGLAAAVLALGYPDAARSPAEDAARAAPLDPEVLLLSGCVAASLGDALAARRLPSAPAAREEAEVAFRDVLVRDAGLLEARLRLGKLLIDTARPHEATRLLTEVEARTGDDRQRYLARLFLGRAAERNGRCPGRCERLPPCPRVLARFAGRAARPGERERAIRRPGARDGPGGRGRGAMNARLLTIALAVVSPQAPPVFHAEVEVVRVEVLVTRGGQPLCSRPRAARTRSSTRSS